MLFIAIYIGLWIFAVHYAGKLGRSRWLAFFLAWFISPVIVLIIYLAIGKKELPTFAANASAAKVIPDTVHLAANDPTDTTQLELFGDHHTQATQMHGQDLMAAIESDINS